MSKNKRPAHDELDLLTEAVKQAERRLAHTERLAVQHFGPLPGLKARERALWGSGDDEAAAAAREERQALEAELPDWNVRLEGVREAVDAAQRARHGFIQEHGDDLIAELAPDAAEARDSLERVLREVLDVHRGLMQLTATLNTYSGDHRRHRRDDPALAALAVACDRVLNVSGIPDPMPLPALVVEEVA